MKYPKLVPPRVCTTLVRVVFFGELQTDGTEEIIGEWSGKCNLMRRTKQRVTADRQIVTVEATALFDGDIAPDIFDIQGELYINGEKPYRIFRSAKEINPDGTVNYTRLELA